MPKTNCFLKFMHIKKPCDFANVFKNGYKVSILGAKLFYLPNGKDFNRIGFALCRGFGNAVQRNATKRKSREAFRLLQGKMTQGFDMVFLNYNKDKSFAVYYDMLQALCKKAHIIV